MAAQTKTKFKRLSIEKCGECGADSARLFCGRCQQQYYCSDECQLEHWTAHKPDCVPVEEQDRRKKLGEMMVKAGGDGQLRLVQQLVEGRGVDVNFVSAEWASTLRNNTACACPSCLRASRPCGDVSATHVCLPLARLALLRLLLGQRDETACASTHICPRHTAKRPSYIVSGARLARLRQLGWLLGKRVITARVLALDGL